MADDMARELSVQSRRSQVDIVARAAQGEGRLSLLSGVEFELVKHRELTRPEDRAFGNFVLLERSLVLGANR